MIILKIISRDVTQYHEFVNDDLASWTMAAFAREVIEMDPEAEFQIFA